MCVRNRLCPPATACAVPTCSHLQCASAPVWPDGSASPQPACPLAGQDPDGNLVQDHGEVWTGGCDHSGECTGCSSDAQCDDSDPCTADHCDNATGICSHDADAYLGQACSSAKPSCVNGTCCNQANVACSGNCARCDTTGACVATSSLCSGGCASCANTGSPYNCAAKQSMCSTTSCTDCVGSGTVFACSQYDSGLGPTTCPSGKDCYAAGVCRTKNGLSCGKASDCLSGICAVSTCLWDGAAASCNSSCTYSYGGKQYIARILASAQISLGALSTSISGQTSDITNSNANDGGCDSTDVPGATASCSANWSHTYTASAGSGGVSGSCNACSMSCSGSWH